MNCKHFKKIMKVLTEKYDRLRCLLHSSSNRKSLVPLVFKLDVFKSTAEVGQQIWRQKHSNPDRSFKVFLYWWMWPVLQIRSDELRCSGFLQLQADGLITRVKARTDKGMKTG